MIFAFPFLTHKSCLPLLFMVYCVSCSSLRASFVCVFVRVSIHVSRVRFAQGVLSFTVSLFVFSNLLCAMESDDDSSSSSSPASNGREDHGDFYDFEENLQEREVTVGTTPCSSTSCAKSPRASRAESPRAEATRGKLPSALKEELLLKKAARTRDTAPRVEPSPQARDEGVEEDKGTRQGSGKACERKDGD